MPGQSVDLEAISYIQAQPLPAVLVVHKLQAARQTPPFNGIRPRSYFQLLSAIGVEDLEFRVLCPGRDEVPVGVEAESRYCSLLVPVGRKGEYGLRWL